MKFKKELEVIPVVGRSVIKPNEETDLHCLFRIKTDPPNEENKRKPIDLACVLDVSGSMAGGKLKWSKRAIRKIVKHLLPIDRLHFIVYDSRVRVIFENGDLDDKEKLVNSIRAIRAGDYTNISGGLEKANEILKKNNDPIFSKRIFLFSDGHANEGIRTNEGLFELVERYHKESNIITSSFGIGNDFKEDLMTGIASVGKGRYFFLDSESITKKVSKAIHGLLGQVGTNCELHISGVESRLEKIYGRDDLQKFVVGDLFSDNTKNILVRFNLPPKQASSEEEEVVFCEYVLSYDSREQGEVNIKGVVSVRVEERESFEDCHSTIVNISIMVKRTADDNAHIARLLSENNIPEAIKVLENLNLELQKFVELDETGKIKRLMEKGQEDLEKLKSRNARHNVSSIVKRATFTSYQCDEDSSEGFESGCDSDEWSGMENNSINININNNNDDDDDDIDDDTCSESSDDDDDDDDTDDEEDVI